MRVLLLGATGNLGLRCIPSLVAHSHTVTLYVRNIQKLHSLVSPSLISQLHAIVQGDATDAAGIKQAILDHDIEGIIDVAGNQVLPWKEYVLPKIAKAVADAAVAAGKERGGNPLRVWITAGAMSLKYPGPGGYMVSDLASIFKPAMYQHEATRQVIAPIPTSEIRWSLLCVGRMYPSDPSKGPIEPLQAPYHHDLFVQTEVIPGWQHSWVEGIPFIGVAFWFMGSQIWRYTSPYEDVADVLARDLKEGREDWVGKKVGYIMKEKIKSV